jgi:hypothetical protein
MSLEPVICPFDLPDAFEVPIKCALITMPQVLVTTGQLSKDLLLSSILCDKQWIEDCVYYMLKAVSADAKYVTISANLLHSPSSNNESSSSSPMSTSSTLDTTETQSANEISDPDLEEEDDGDNSNSNIIVSVDSSSSSVVSMTTL